MLSFWITWHTRSKVASFGTEAECYNSYFPYAFIPLSVKRNATAPVFTFASVYLGYKFFASDYECVQYLK